MDKKIKPLVSLILLVNNEAVRLPKLFLTLSHQKTSTIFELIVIDSSSSDKSQEIVFEIIEKIWYFSSVGNFYL